MPLDILVLSFFPAFFPPASGGELRLVHLYRELAAWHRVTLVTSTDFDARPEEIVHNARLREFRFPKDDLWRHAYAALDRAGAAGDLSGLAFALAVANPRCLLRRTAVALARSADIVIHEFPYSEPIFADRPPPIELYNAHNVEVGLSSSVLSGGGSSRCFSKTLRLERKLIGRARRVFATSPDDGELFRVFYGLERDRLSYCPNGYNEADLAPLRAPRQTRLGRPASRPKLLFIGSQHPPNVEAATYLLQLAKTLPECDLQIAGAVSTRIAAEDRPANVTLVGPFDDARKRTLIESADLFLNPVVEGSGTSLKAIEALAALLPMVSTPEGARGLGLQHDKHAVLCDRAAFPAAIRSLLADTPRRTALAEAGALLAAEKFAWPVIAERLATELSEVAAAEPRTAAPSPIAVAFNNFPVTPTVSGGSVRIREVLGGLGIDTVLITFGERSRVELIQAGFVQVMIAKTEAHSALETNINRDRPVSVNDIISSLHCLGNPLLVDILAGLAPRCAVAIFEHCYMAPLIEVLDKLADPLPIVYSAHNIEWRHKNALLREHPLRSSLVEYTKRIEAKLIGAADLVVSCSREDAEYFAALGKRTVVVANGTELLGSALPRERPSQAKHRVGFLGSAHPPNVEAADFIMRALAPRFPQASFEFVGDVCTAVAERPASANVVLHGVVDAARKSEILLGWSVALNPVESGGGSSLKVPDYMAHALPIISTPVGGRDFPLAETRSGIIAERAEFGSRLRELLDEPRLGRALAANAVRYATDSLGWHTAVAPYRREIAKLAQRRAPAIVPRRSLLVVTYRYTEPPLGGAETYLIEAVRRMRTQCGTIDLAAIDLGALGNRYHFASDYSGQGAGSSRVLAECFDTVHLFEPDPPTGDLLQRCRGLERAWLREERELYRPFVDTLAANDTPSLFAGFYAPEIHDGAARRWTAASFSFLLPARARAFRVSGWAPFPKQLRFSAIMLSVTGPVVSAEYRQAVNGSFSCTMLLAPETAAGFTLLNCTTNEHVVKDDYRPFGVYVTEAVILAEAPIGPAERDLLARPLATVPVDLARENEAILRTQCFPQWLDALLCQAAARPEEDEAEFALVRGPHSRQMQGWLARHAAAYDAVLVQGIPFDVIPSTVETLAGLDRPPRVVTLPHFHADDRFYFWRRYLEAFARADTNLLFSEAAAERLREHGQFAVIPGGAVALEEQPCPSDIAQLRSLCPSADRFYLVLGRITGSKRHDRVIRAYAELRRAGARFDLVVIGPYESGPEPGGEGVHYLAAQPRGVVLAALSECIGLVTMSESESFGITICEAWKFNKPVIANAACHAFRDLVRHGENGILVDTDSELNEAMAILAGNPQLAARLGEAGFRAAASRFTWQHVADALAAVLFPAAGQLPAAACQVHPDLPAVIGHVAG